MAINILKALLEASSEYDETLEESKKCDDKKDEKKECKKELCNEAYNVITEGLEEVEELPFPLAALPVIAMEEGGFLIDSYDMSRFILRNNLTVEESFNILNEEIVNEAGEETMNAITEKFETETILKNVDADPHYSEVPESLPEKDLDKDLRDKGAEANTDADPAFGKHPEKPADPAKPTVVTKDSCPRCFKNGFTSSNVCQVENPNGIKVVIHEKNPRKTCCESVEQELQLLTALKEANLLVICK